MTAALRALMSGVIDYAGLFPPAKLPLEDAVREYLAIRESPEAWLPGAFVIPASRVAELEPWADQLFRTAKPTRLSLLGRTSDDSEIWKTHLSEDLNRAGVFLARQAEGVRSSVWEIALPPRYQDPGLLGAILVGAADVFRSQGTSAVYCEIPNSPQADELRRSVIELHSQNQDSLFFGFKIRTGGLTPDAFPSVERLAAIIQACQRHKCRWKATAGLHHPLRHTDAQLGVKTHGFLNVLFAAVLADAHSLQESVIAEILADEDAANFHVTDEGVHWRDYEATVAQIDSTRSKTFQSFGSCSFAEPRDDLKKLGLL
jgi:hypothetical protein